MARISGIYTVLDPQFRQDMTPVQIAQAVLAGGGNIIQLRMKNKSTEEVLPHAQAIATLKNQYDFTFIINDYVDVALQVGADGVHVGQDDAPVKALKQKYGKQLLVGYSSHNIAEAINASGDGADYVALGAVFATKTKAVGHHICGLDELKKLVQTVKVPVVAIGGIKQNNLDSVLATGVNCVAMITEILQAVDIAKRLTILTAMLQSSITKV